MVNGNAGKGSQYRPVDKRTYDRNYLRLFGEVCLRCQGTGKCGNEFSFSDKDVSDCPNCGGLGFVPKKKGAK